MNSCVRCGNACDYPARICSSCDSRYFSAQAECTAKAAVPRLYCKRCGHSRDRHVIVNYANGAFASGETYICPTAIFVEDRE